MNNKLIIPPKNNSAKASVPAIPKIKQEYIKPSTDKPYMDYFISVYEKMSDSGKWKLSTGKVVEDELFKFGKTCDTQHLCHSFIMDPNDQIYTTHDIFTMDELKEIRKTNAVVFPELPDDIVDDLAKFSHATTPKELHKQIYLFSDYKLDYNPERDAEKDWITRTLNQWVLLYEDDSTFLLDHSKQWYQSRVWLCIEHAFERVSQLQPSRIDMIVRSDNTDLFDEDDDDDDSDKNNKISDSAMSWEERELKIGQELNANLMKLFREVGFKKDKIRKLLSFGISTFKYDLYFDVCDFKNGYVTRITRSKRYVLPNELTRIRDILLILSAILVIKRMVNETTEIVTRPSNKDKDIQKSLKRPFSNDSHDYHVPVKRNQHV